MEKIWSSIHKPEKYENRTIHDYFIFEFELLAHKIYAPEEFEKGTKELSERFNLNHKQCILPAKREDATPLDGLSYFVKQTWATIRDQRDLNVPE